jgi:hypothetical protein
VSVSPTGLARRLRPVLVAPSALAALLGGREALQAFRRVVQEVFPDRWREIWDARERDGDREAARVWSFCARVEAELFPLWEGDAYEHVAFEVPVLRFGWSFDRYHEPVGSPGEALLLALCAPPFLVGAGARLAILDAAEALVGRELVAEVPEGGLEPEELHVRVDGTPYEGAGLFADWLWGQTDAVFLDADDEVEVSIEWTRENVDELARQWRRAQALLDRVAELTRWLEADPAHRFARLLDAALGRDAHATYLQERRHYELEITQNGIVPVRHDDAGALALPEGAAG